MLSCHRGLVYPMLPTRNITITITITMYMSADAVEVQIARGCIAVSVLSSFVIVFQPVSSCAHDLWRMVLHHGKRETSTAGAACWQYDLEVRCPFLCGRDGAPGDQYS